MTRGFIVLAAVFLLAYIFIAPPFQTPDEVGHFWRAYSIANGTLNPTMTMQGPSADVPGGVRKLVATLWVMTAGDPNAKIGIERIRAAMQVELERDAPRNVPFLAFYTPVPYTPQITACFLGNTLGVRPLYTFYLGRLFNAAAFLLLALYAMRRLRVSAAVALVPMALYLAASFSPDAMTLGVAMVVTALVLVPDRLWKLIAAALVLALCKPVYFLLPLAALVTMRQRARFAMVLPIILGVALSASVASRNVWSMRGDAPTDARAQMENVINAPMRFAGIAARDLLANGDAYAHQMIGVLGWVDVPLPMSVALLMLVALFFVSTPPIDVRTRVVCLAIVIVTIGGISLSQYLAWTPPGAMSVDGIQGRYFLPLLPMLLAAVGHRREWKWMPAVYAGIAVVVNVFALSLLWRRYW